MGPFTGFYCTDRKQINSRKLLKVLFKHVFPINRPQMDFHKKSFCMVSHTKALVSECRDTNADAGVGIGWLRGDSKNLIEKVIN